MNEVAKKVNGFTIPTVLVGVVITGLLGYGKLTGEVDNNTEEITILRKVPTEVTEIKTDVKYIKEDITEFKVEQRVIQMDIRQILQAVK